MRILLFLGSLRNGGAERQFSQLASGLSGRGHDVRIATVYPGGLHWDRLSERTPELLDALFPVRSAFKGTRILNHIRAPWVLRERIADFEPDIVYSALHQANLMAWLAVRLCRDVQLVWGIRASADQLNPARAIPFRICSLLSKGVPLIIANSRAGQLYHASRGFRPGRWDVVPNGIDLVRFQFSREGRCRVRQEWGIGQQGKLVGIVGRPNAMKAHADFLAAADILSRSRDDVRFVCVGVDEKGAASLNLGALSVRGRAHVHWAGTRRDMAAVYSALDVLVLPSRYGEGFPNVVGEGMACGVPCVVTDVGDARRIVGDLGMVVPPSQPTRLAGAVEAALGTSRVGPGAAQRRQRIVDCFGLEQCVLRTEQLLLKLYEQRR